MNTYPNAWHMVLALYQQGEAFLTPNIVVKRLNWSMQQAAQVLNDMSEHGVLQSRSDPKYGVIFQHYPTPQQPAYAHHGHQQHMMPYQGQQHMAPYQQRQEAWLGAVLSVIFPGLGQMYNREIGKGIATMMATIFLWFILLGWVVHLWSIYDAYQVGRRMRQQQDAYYP